MTPCLVWSLPPAPEAVGATRRRLREHLDDLPEHQLQDVLLVASEVVTNAVRHGEGSVVVRLRADSAVLRMDVSDGGRAAPVLAQQDDAREGGWGLHIVEHLATRWGVLPARAGPGKTVWFEIDTSSPASSAR